MSMFCYQCEQTAKGTGCTIQGVCGKDADTAALQDLVVHLAKGIARYAHRSRQMGAKDFDVDHYVVKALFTTVTNVNFDPARLEKVLREGEKILDAAKATYEQACKEAGKQPEQLGCPAGNTLAGTLQELIAQGQEVSIASRLGENGTDVTALQELLTYGLKGTAAYADHAQILGQEDDEVYAYFHEALDFLTTDDAKDIGKLCRRCSSAAR